MHTDPRTFPGLKGGFIEFHGKRTKHTYLHGDRLWSECERVDFVLCRQWFECYKK